MNKLVPAYGGFSRRSASDRQSRMTGPRKPVATRRYDLAYLNEDNQPTHQQIVAPALPLFEAAFSALGRGLLLTTTDGPCAAEDLTPGMMVETVECGPLPILWIGSMQIIPNMPADQPERSRLVRIMADRFGIGRPIMDMILGPGARLLRGTGSDAHYVPACDMADGDGVFQLTPPAPTRVFHICLPRHATIQAEGLHLESYHPRGCNAELLGPDMLRVFLDMFPHISTLSDFGPLAHPRSDDWQNLRGQLY